MRLLILGYLPNLFSAERYGNKLKARIASGEINEEDLKQSTIREEKIIL